MLGQEIVSKTVSGGDCDSHSKNSRKGLSMPFLFRKREKERTGEKTDRGERESAEEKGRRGGI